MSRSPRHRDPIDLLALIAIVAVLLIFGPPVLLEILGAGR